MLFRSAPSCCHSTFFFLYFSLWPASRPWNPSPSSFYRTSTEEPPLFSGSGRRPPNPESWVPSLQRVCLGSRFSYSSLHYPPSQDCRVALQPSERPRDGKLRRLRLRPPAAQAAGAPDPPTTQIQPKVGLAQRRQCTCSLRGWLRVWPPAALASFVYSPRSS